MSPPSKSIRRLIIFSAVVLPPPEGPTSMQISPAPTRRQSSLTAGWAWPGYVFVARSKTISAAVPPPSAPLIGAILPLWKRRNPAHEQAGAEPRRGVDVGRLAVHQVSGELEAGPEHRGGEICEIDVRELGRA